MLELLKIVGEESKLEEGVVVVGAKIFGIYISNFCYNNLKILKRLKKGEGERVVTFPEDVFNGFHANISVKSNLTGGLSLSFADRHEVEKKELLNERGVKRLTDSITALK